MRRPPRTIEVSLEIVECAACGRSLLRGEHAKVFVDADMMRRMVCDLCVERAARAGWLPADAQGPAQRDRGDSPLFRTVDRDSVVDRALEMFNASHFPQVVAGVAQSLGRPVVSVLPCRKRGDIVSIVVAWRLTWFRYEVDPLLGVRLVGQGEQLSELAPYERLSNAAADDDGCLRGEALAA